MGDQSGYRVGDVANGYQLTEHGWQPVQPADRGAPPAYRVGDVANGHVLTPQGWQPVRPAYQPTPGTGRRTGLIVAIVVVAVVVLAAIGAAALLVTSARRGSEEAAPSATTAASSPSSSAPSTEPTSPEPSTSQAPETPTPVPEGKPFAWGETAALSFGGVDAAEITVAAPVEFAATNPADQPGRGRLVYVPVMVKVTGKQDVTVDPYDFQVVLPDGEQVDVTFVAGLPKTAPGNLDAKDLPPGKTVIGSLPFDVPSGVPLKVAYAPDQKVLGTWK